MSPAWRGVALAVGWVLALTVPSGCGPALTPVNCPTEPRPGLAIAVGGRANSPTPVVPAEVREVIDHAIDSGQGITIIRVDGRPSIACALTYSSDAANPVAAADDLRRFRDLVHGVIVAAQAHEPEADPLTAVSHATAAAGTGGTVVLMDSGLQTVAPLDFRAPGLLDANPTSVAAELGARGHLPDLTRRTVILSGIGYTAAPQALLDEGRRHNLVQIWKAIMTAARASSVTVVTAPNTTVAMSDVPEVSEVDVPPLDNIAIGCDTESILSNDGAVGFLPDTTTFTDPAAARQTLGEYAQWLVQNPSAHVALVGTVAHYGRDEGNTGLGRARAERVRTVLIESGAGSAQISARGDGWGPFPTKSAPPSPAFDQRNRRVVVTIICG